MGYDLLAAMAFVVLTPLTLLGFAAYWVLTHRERTAVEDAWRRYAAAQGLAFEEADGEWPNRTSPRVRWTEGSARCELLTLGRESRAHTRLVVEPEPKILGTLVVVARTPAVLTVRARPAALEERLLLAEVRAALGSLAGGGPVSLAYRRGRIVIEWRGRETSPARLDEARRLSAAIVPAVEAAFHAAAAA